VTGEEQVPLDHRRDVVDRHDREQCDVDDVVEVVVAQDDLGHVLGCDPARPAGAG
jgi:hypothetical protein